MKRSLCVLGLLWATVAHAKMRVAHLGLELDGSWAWMREVSLIPDAELVAVAEANPTLLDRARRETKEGVQHFADYVRLLDEIKPDAVTVTVPNSRHLEVVRQCARRHIHVWFQKPMAASAAEAREMHRLATAAGIVLMANYHPQWSAPLRALNARLADVGDIEQIEVRHAFAVSKVLSPTYEGYFLQPDLHGGGALMDQGTYGIDYVVSLLGKPTRVYATGKTLHPRPGLKVEDEAWVILDYPKATAIVYGGWWAHPDGVGIGFTRVTGTKGELRRDLNTVTFTRADKLEAVPLPAVPLDQRGGIGHFLDCIRTGQPVLPPHSSALNVIVNEVVDAAYTSMRTHRAIDLP